MQTKLLLFCLYITSRTPIPKLSPSHFTVRTPLCPCSYFKVFLFYSLSICVWRRVYQACFLNQHPVASIRPLSFLFWSVPELFGCVAPFWPLFHTRLCPLNDNEYYVLWGSCLFCPLASKTSQVGAVVHWNILSDSSNRPIRNVITINGNKTLCTVWWQQNSF